MKKALVLFDKTVKENKWNVKLVAWVHDEAQIECKPEIADKVGQAFVQAIKDAGVVYNLRCPLSGEYSVGANWRETH
jgi:DNA polymerase I-like protein with 3'-5' exonuclease and polymerase domains